MKPSLHRLSDAEHATVLAALRFYQQCGLADFPDRRPTEIQEIADNGGTVTPLDGAAIDILCLRLNSDELTRLIQDILDLDQLEIDMAEDAEKAYRRDFGRKVDPIQRN